jgi:hypothetical protein
MTFIYCRLKCRVSKLIDLQMILFIHSFVHQWIYSPLLGPGLFFSFVIFFTQTVGFLGRGISPSQGHYLHIGQHKHRINAHTQTYMPWVGFELTIPVFERAKIVHASYRAATVTGADVTIDNHKLLA